MSRPCAPLLAAWLALGGCAPEIVLGDREAPLPASAGNAAAAGSGGSGEAGSGAGGGSQATAGTTAGGSSAGSAEQPVPGALIWSTDHETGDFQGWEEGGDYYGGEYDWGDISIDVERGTGRDDSRGLFITIDTSARTEPSQGARVYRRIEERAAFYTAWFRLEEAHSVADWWSISLFHARDAKLTLDDDLSLWDVRVVDLPSGAMALQFFDHDTMQGTTADARGIVEPGTWFELGFYLDYRPPSDSRIMILRDGEVLIDVARLHTSVEEHVFWSLGNGAGHLSPPESSLTVDDASIRWAEAAQ